MDTQLEEMRQQMQMLKEKLEQQQIVNDRVVRRAIRRNVSSINNRYLHLSLLCLVMIPFSYWTFVIQNGLSPAFGYGTIIYFLICIGYYYWNERDMRSDHLIAGDLLETLRKVARAKKRDRDWLLVGFPMMTVWMAWYLWEGYQKGGEASLYYFLFIAVFGGLTGLALGLRLHFKTQRQYQEIIDQIEEVSRMESGQEE